VTKPPSENSGHSFVGRLKTLVGVVLVDAVLVGIAGWLYVREGFRTLSMIIIGMVWVITPVILWRSSKKAQAR